MPLSFADVEKIASSLPDVAIGARWDNKTWMVNGNGFAWERALGKRDSERFGDERVPQSPILAVICENLDEKDALLAMELPGFFTIEHFNGYPAVLIELKKARVKDVRIALESAHRIATAKKPNKRKPKARAKARAKAKAKARVRTKKKP